MRRSALWRAPIHALLGKTTSRSTSSENRSMRPKTRERLVPPLNTVVTGSSLPSASLTWSPAATARTSSVTQKSFSRNAVSRSRWSAARRTSPVSESRSSRSRRGELVRADLASLHALPDSGYDAVPVGFRRVVPVTEHLEHCDLGVVEVAAGHIVALVHQDSPHAGRDGAGGDQLRNRGQLGCQVQGVCGPHSGRTDAFAAEDLQGHVLRGWGQYAVPGPLALVVQAPSQPNEVPARGGSAGGVLGGARGARQLVDVHIGTDGQSRQELPGAVRTRHGGGTHDTLSYREGRMLARRRRHRKTSVRSAQRQLAALRNQKRLTQGDLAKATGVGQSEISRIPDFVKAAATIRKNKDGITAAIERRLSNGRHEGLNNKIRTMTRRAYGFHSPDAALALVMLTCGPTTLTLPYHTGSHPHS